jgi:hypothetical protein
MSLIKQAVAAALVTAVATSAYAVDVSNYKTDTTVTNVYVSGSTAANIVLEQAFIHTTSGGISAICDSNIDVYSDAADTKNPAAQLFIYCHAKSALGLPGNVALFKESTLGSANGSKPLIAIAKANSGSANTLPFVNANTLVDTNCATAAAGTLAGAQAYTFHGSCTFPTVVPSVAITGGISDVEAPLVGTSASDVTKYLTGVPGLAVVWAVPVNLPFYRALQTGQGLATTDAPGTVPSLTHAQIAAIYSQQLADPSQIVGVSGPITAAGTIIGVCRREFGSGTEASAELNWLGEGCGTSDLAIPPGDNTNVFENTSTGKIAGCLTALDQGGTINGTTIPASGRYAIGIASSENGTSTWGPGTDVRVVAVDGALPTLENVVNGYYPFFSEDVLYNISSSSLYTGNPKKVWEAVKSNIGAPGFLADSNKAFQNYWGQSGDLAPPTIYGAPATIPATQASVQSSPINGLSKSANGAVNNCDPAVVFGSSNTASYQFLNK